MASRSFSSISKQVATLFLVGTAAGRTDASLLESFRDGPTDESEAAFAVLVERHGPMVMNVCRRILGDRHDAEDAAQATFLVLARQAHSIRRVASVASWLHGVAARVAGRARRDAARRRLCEHRVAEAATETRSANDDDPDASETSHELYEELGRLPERFRLPILLCHLEGLTYEQAAIRIGCPVRTVQSRLARARQRLRDRLARRGLGASVSPLVAFRSPANSAFVTEGWKQATVQAALRHAANGASTAMVSATVAALAEGASKAMFLHRLMNWSAFLLLIGVAAGGAGMTTMMLAQSEPAQQAAPAPTLARTPPPDVPEDNRYLVKMPGGASIEVVAISTLPTGPATWWKPDGSPLAEAPVDAIKPRTVARDGQTTRLILVRASGLKKDDMFRWHPTPPKNYWGGRPTKDGQKVPGLEYYDIAFESDRAVCGVEVKLAAGDWKPEVSNDGKGGRNMGVNGHRYAFGKARASTSRGRPVTVFAVAHNFFGQDRRIVAVDKEGKEHPADAYSAGSDGDKKWVIDLIDGEFSMPPDQIREYQVQFRPFEEVEIQAIALSPRPIGRPPIREDKANLGEPIR